MLDGDKCYQKAKAEQGKGIWSLWWWLDCHLKQGGHVSFTEKATFDARLTGSKRVIHVSTGEEEHSEKENSLPGGSDKQQGDSVSGASDEVREIMGSRSHKTLQTTQGLWLLLQMKRGHCRVLRREVVLSDLGFKKFSVVAVVALNCEEEGQKHEI